MGEWSLKCEKCGTVNLPDSRRCRMCGSLFPGAGELPGNRIRCPHCQAENYVQEKVCTVCQRDLLPTARGKEGPAKVIPTDEWEKMRGYEDLPHHTRRMAWVSLGGILVIMAGALGVGDGVVMVGLYAEWNLLDVDSVLCSSLMLIFGVMAIMGGVLAVMRMQFPLAVVGAVCGILAYGCVLGSILSIIGLILIVCMKREFSR